MYGKVFTEIFDSSLMAEGGWLPTYVFMSMISFADKKGRVKQDPRTLYRRIGLNIDERVSFGEFMDAIDYLQADDDYSNLPNHNGKRLIPASETEEIEGKRGWLIVNYVHYRDKGGSIEQRRANDAARKRKERENKKLQEDVGKSHVTSAHTDTDTDTDKDLNNIAWGLYVQHRKELKAKKLTERGATIAKNKLKQLSHGDQMRCVERTIANGWTGLFPEKLTSDETNSRNDSFGAIQDRNRREAGLI